MLGGDGYVAAALLGVPQLDTAPRIHHPASRSRLSHASSQVRNHFLQRPEAPYIIGLKKEEI